MKNTKVHIEFNLHLSNAYSNKSKIAAFQQSVSDYANYPINMPSCANFRPVQARYWQLMPCLQGSMVVVINAGLMFIHAQIS